MKTVKSYQDATAFDQVKDTLEVLDFGFKTQQAITDTLADGKVNLFDVPNVLKPLLAAGAAIEGFENVKVELTNLTPEGRAIVAQFVNERFDIPNEQLEALIEETVDEVIGDISVAFKWLSYRKPKLI